jgi:hypothetical protein
VIGPKPSRAQRKFWPKLGSSEGIDHATEQVTIAQHGVDRDLASASDQARIKYVSLRKVDKTGEAVALPTRYPISDEESLKERVV